MSIKSKAPLVKDKKQIPLPQITRMTALQKGISHRKGAKDAKIFKDEVQDFKSFAKRFAFPSRIINVLRALRCFAVKRFVFSVDSRILTDEKFKISANSCNACTCVLVQVSVAENEQV